MKFKNDRQRKAVMAKLHVMRNKGRFLFVPDKEKYVINTVLKTNKNKVEFAKRFPQSKGAPLYVAQQIKHDSEDAKAKKRGYSDVTISEIKYKNKELGMFFFSPSTMRFFNSKTESKGFKSNKTGKTYFVTSERQELYMPKKYTVRQQAKDGAIDTVGEFNKIRSKNTAIQKAKELARTK